MSVRRVAGVVFLCGLVCTFAHTQGTADDPDVLLKQGLRYGDLYNWADAASLFTQAEQLYSVRGEA